MAWRTGAAKGRRTIVIRVTGRACRNYPWPAIDWTVTAAAAGQQQRSAAKQTHENPE